MHAKLSGRACRYLIIAGVSLGLAAVTVACASSTSTRPTPSPSPSAPTTGAAAQAAVKADWVAFFDAKTPVSRRVGLLQNGQAFASVIKSQATSPLAASASASVTKVSLVSPAEARVTYSILVSGTRALPNQSGVAVYQDGSWKVGESSFCGLLILENGGKTTGLPAACSAAS